MAASAADIASVRRMVAEPTTATYSDATLTTIIERYPLPDASNELPMDEDGTTVNSEWVATYDLNAAAADVWMEKAAALAGGYDFTADGATFNRSQAMKQAREMASFYRSRRYARSRPVYAEINEIQVESWIGNLAEEDE